MHICEIAIAGQFPGEHGLVAPGMSCHYGIRFAPDSLMDYDDEIRIQTQSSEPIIVPLQSRRQPPLISCNYNLIKAAVFRNGSHTHGILIYKKLMQIENLYM
jgi:hypothetical protein